MTQTPQDGHNLPTEDSTPPQGLSEAQGSNPTSTEGKQMTNINQILQAIADLNFELGKANLEPHVSEVLEAALEAGVSRRCTEAKIDELKYWQWKTDGHIELSGKEVEDRLAHLQQELGEDGKGSY